MARFVAVWAAAWLGGCGDPDPVHPVDVAPEAEPWVEAHAVSGPSCDPVPADVDMVWGGQGKFHIELGAIVASSGGDVALHIDVTDAETGERVAGTVDIGAYVALADWSAASGEGWAFTRAVVGGSDWDPVDLGCALDGRALHVSVDVCAVPATDVCSTTEADILVALPADLAVEVCGQG